MVKVSEQSVAARQNYVAVQIWPDVDVTHHDGRLAHLVQTPAAFVQDLRFEQRFQALLALLCQSQHVAIRQFLGQHLCIRGVVPVRVDLAELFLNVVDDIHLSRGGELLALRVQHVFQVRGQVSAGCVDHLHRVRQRIALLDGHARTLAFPRLHYHSAGLPVSDQSQHGRYLCLETAHVEGLEHYFGHLFALVASVCRRFCQEHVVLLWRHLEFLLESMVPNLFHIVPVVHKPSLDRFFQHQNSSFLDRLITHIRIFLVHAHHDPWHFRFPYHSWKYATRGVIPRKSCLHYSAPIINNNCWIIVIV